MLGLVVVKLGDWSECFGLVFLLRVKLDDCNLGWVW